MGSTLDAVRWPARTARLLLRPTTESDLPIIFAYRSQPEVSRWIGRTVNDLDDFVGNFLDPTSGIEALTVQHHDVIVGDLMLEIEDAWGQREVADQVVGTQGLLGWTFHPEHQGQGFATEAVSELLRICFEDLGLRRVKAECFADNEASWRLMERVNMRRETHAVADSLHRDLGWVDGYGYAMLADEWRRHVVSRDSVTR